MLHIISAIKILSHCWKAIENIGTAHTDQGADPACILLASYVTCGSCSLLCITVLNENVVIVCPYLNIKLTHYTKFYALNAKGSDHLYVT